MGVGSTEIHQVDRRGGSGKTSLILGTSKRRAWGGEAADVALLVVASVGRRRDATGSDGPTGDGLRRSGEHRASAAISLGVAEIRGVVIERRRGCLNRTKIVVLDL